MVFPCDLHVGVNAGDASKLPHLVLHHAGYTFFAIEVRLQVENVVPDELISEVVEIE